MMLNVPTLAAEGNDPSIKQLLERTYLDSYREALPELGPHVASSIPRRRALRTSFPPRERTPSRPEGTLIAHLVEHTAKVTAVAVAPDQLFFATGSEDGTVKIWDTMRLEKNVTSKSRQTFRQGGKVTAVVMLESSHCVASASTNGTVWIHRVDVGLSGTMPKYSKPALIRQYKVDEKDDFVTCLASFNTREWSGVSLRCIASGCLTIFILRNDKQPRFRHFALGNLDSGHPHHALASLLQEPASPWAHHLDLHRPTTLVARSRDRLGNAHSVGFAIRTPLATLVDRTSGN